MNVTMNVVHQIELGYVLLQCPECKTVRLWKPEETHNVLPYCRRCGQEKEHKSILDKTKNIFIP